jgi:hypothetical protein
MKWPNSISSPRSGYLSPEVSDPNSSLADYGSWQLSPTDSPDIVSSCIRQRSPGEVVISYSPVQPYHIPIWKSRYYLPREVIPWSQIRFSHQLFLSPKRGTVAEVPGYSHRNAYFISGPPLVDFVSIHMSLSSAYSLHDVFTYTVVYTLACALACLLFIVILCRYLRVTRLVRSLQVDRQPKHKILFISS